MYCLTKATKNDLSMIIDLKLKTISESDIDNTISSDEQKKIETYVKKSINGHISDCYLIITNNNTAGMVIFYDYEDGILLDDLYLIEKYRSHGIGTMIIENIIKDHSKIYLWVYKSNDRAIALYQRLKFKIIEETDTRYKMLYQK
jgi:ribosomal protein S18 acetylase RimI-like enzyme